MSKYIEKISRLFRIIKENGGVLGSVRTVFRMEELKTGTLVGEDELGNKYFHNPMYFVGRSRWVVYSDAAGHDYDGSQVPAEWHRWLSYISDETPDKADLPKYPWLAKHTENQSGTPQEYVPYSTTRPKIQAWKPKTEEVYRKHF
ncbi:probable NADH dehydrogenase [ubiquinone] 1 alpha subcomplex subunit 12 [Littorina saxatilis]|uniref:NADH dehydrogenase [ubiquinone] 1 alpha subcomplex subunit 12 n=1 Tax=Littorina saxatilis TaxID=31220 RepID=A0AAN9GBE6_9CAEN